MANTTEALNFARDLEVAALKGVAPPQNWTSEAVRHIKALTAASAEVATPVAYGDRLGTYFASVHIAPKGDLPSWMQHMTPLYTAMPQASQPGQPVKKVSGLGIAGIAVKHFGNPIPEAAYSFARELLQDESAPIGQPVSGAMTDERSSFIKQFIDTYGRRWPIAESSTLFRGKWILKDEFNEVVRSNEELIRQIDEYVANNAFAESFKEFLVRVRTNLLSASGQAGQSKLLTLSGGNAKPANPDWCEGCTPENCCGCGRVDPAQQTEAQQHSVHAKLEQAIEFIRVAPHGDNCFVSDHYEGDPGNRCNCGKDSLLEWLEEGTEAQQSDTARLDFLEKQAVIAKPGQKIRAAIDAAIAKEKAK